MHVHSWNFFTFKIYIYNTFLQNVMVVGDSVQKLWPFWYSTLVESQNFLIKPLKLECAIKSRVYTHLGSNFDQILIKMIQRSWKNRISKKFQTLTPHEQIPIFPVLNQKFLIGISWCIFKKSISQKPFTMAFYRHQSHDHSNFCSKDIDIQSRHLVRHCFG